MFAMLLYLQTTRMPEWSPPKTESAECVGADRFKRAQTLTLVNRWSASDGRMVLYIQHDSTGLLRSGDWLENEGLGYEGSDRKYGLSRSWGRYDQFSKHVGDRFIRLVIEETGMASAKVRYLWRPYPTRYHYEAGTVLLIGTCKLFVGDELRSLRNLPKLEPSPR